MNIAIISFIGGIFFAMALNELAKAWGRKMAECGRRKRLL